MAIIVSVMDILLPLFVWITHQRATSVVVSSAVLGYFLHKIDKAHAGAIRSFSPSRFQFMHSFPVFGLCGDIAPSLFFGHVSPRCLS